MVQLCPCMLLSHRTFRVCRRWRMSYQTRKKERVVDTLILYLVFVCQLLSGIAESLRPLQQVLCQNATDFTARCFGPLYVLPPLQNDMKANGNQFITMVHIYTACFSIPCSTAHFARVVHSRASNFNPEVHYFPKQNELVCVRNKDAVPFCEVRNASLWTQ